jgi:hypothetical protein
MLFSIIIGVLEKFFATELVQYLEKYHAQKKATEVANAPLTNKEEADSFGSWQH